MGWGNLPIPWPEFARRLGGGRPDEAEGDGGDAPAWTRTRPAPAKATWRRAPVRYAELHAHSHFSFLDGASSPEEMAATAAELGLSAIALTDHDGFYGAVRLAEAAQLPTVFGAELSIGLSAPQNGVPDPEGRHLVVLARGVEGYHRLCAAISAAQRAGRKGRPVYDLDDLAARAGGHWQVLTGCRKGFVPAALDAGGSDLGPARAALSRLVAAFGRDNVAVELTDHGRPGDDDRVDVLAALADGAGVRAAATTGAHYATPDRARLAAALAAVRARRSLDEMDGWLPAAGTACLRSPEEMLARFARRPQAVAAAADIGDECAFTLTLAAPSLPRDLSPPGQTDIAWLRKLTMEGARGRYGPPEAERVAGAYAQIEHELAEIERQDFPGYFLVVKKIVDFCREKGIFYQGRGSAANSAVCYALGITVVDPVAYELLFERFLAPEREGPPDIDIDISSERREEVIQEVYRVYGRDRAAQVADVITYRPRSAVRDMAKALGYSPGQQDAWSKQIEGWGRNLDEVEHEIPADVLDLVAQLDGAPRHLGLHSGGMVICDRPVSEVCPVEWASMPGRTVLQWDKDDCAAQHLVKFDLLGLGMLAALQIMVQLIERHYGTAVDVATLPPTGPVADAVYDMLCAADSVGVFQVESRAQMATLPRLRPRKFYDLVVEVALIRPGPIQGDSVHPYIERHHQPDDDRFYAHPSLRRALTRTKGVPLFQEQMMMVAMDAAGCSAQMADQVRRAMDSRKSPEKLDRLKEQLLAGMRKNGIPDPVAADIYKKLEAFANFGFAESHAISFAYLVYSSAYLKRYYPAAFYAGLLGAQPMGFYSPQSLVADARRHGLRVLGPDINRSAARADLEPDEPVAGATLGRPGEPEPTIRLGLESVRQVKRAAAERVVAERDEHGPFADLADAARRTGLGAPALEALAAAGAFGGFGLDRRRALWAAGPAAAERADRLARTGASSAPPPLPAMDGLEQTMADLWSTGVSPDRYPTEFWRPQLDELGVVPAHGLRAVRPGSLVLVGGIVTHRQRPATASGVTFVNLEDETGMVNVICSPAVWQRHRRIARESGALLIHGRLERADGVVNVVAARIRKLAISSPVPSRDFR